MALDMSEVETREKQLTIHVQPTLVPSTRSQHNRNARVLHIVIIRIGGIIVTNNIRRDFAYIPYMEIGRITKYTPSSKGKDSARAMVKRMARRKLRRLGKILLDDTPRLVTKGYAD